MKQWHFYLFSVFAILLPMNADAAPVGTVLFNFAGASGMTPSSPLIMDTYGNLFGTTQFGGAAGEGTVFELSPPALGQTTWTQTVLLSFTGGANGVGPSGGLIMDAQGNLFGTTVSAGAYGGNGTVFELSPPATGQTTWTQTVIYNFSGANGGNPRAGLVKDGQGNLYGTTTIGGPSGSGVIYELSPPSAGQSVWTENNIFDLNSVTGSYPSNLTIDAGGNLYGTTLGGGSGQNGTIFEISPPAKGKSKWTGKALHVFTNAYGGSRGCYALCIKSAARASMRQTKATI